MIEGKNQVDRCGDNILFLRLPVAPTHCQETNWIKVLVNITLVVFYHFAKMHILGSQQVSRDFASFLFLIAITVWLSNINLEPRCLTFYKPLKWFYDIFAVTIFANFILDTIWKQIVLFLNTMVAIAVKYLEESFLANYIYDWLDPENVICLPDLVAFLFILWVLHCFGFWCVIRDFLTWIYCSIICPVKEEIYLRISAPRVKRKC